MFKKNTIYTIAVSHLDTSWLWDLETTVREYIPATLRDNFKLFEAYPGYTFGFEGTYRYELMEEYYPEEFEKMKEYIAAGRWVPVGSAYENGDVNTPSPEALFRNFLYGNSYYREKFGKPSNDIFLPDCFGFGWALPSIARHANLKGFSTGKLAWGSAYGAPFDVGKWHGVDGKSIYANIRPGSYARGLGKVRGHKDIEPKLYDDEKTAQIDGQEVSLPFTVAFYGTGDRGGAPGESSVKTVMKEISKNSSKAIDVKSVSSKEFFDLLDQGLTEQQKEALPTWSNELPLTDHGVGSYTSRTVGHRWNRRAELLADAAERTAVAADWLGQNDYPHENLNTAWKRVIAHQFHDDITGTSFQVCYKRNWNDYMLSQNQFAEEYRASGAGIVSQMDASFVKGIAVAVSNPLQADGDRQETVVAKVKLPKGARYIKVLDDKGKEVASQIVKREKSFTHVAFAASVPSVGIALYDIQESDKPYLDASALRVSTTGIENSKLRVMFNQNGDICEVFDKSLGKNILANDISLDVFDYKGSKSWPAWELTYKELSVPPREGASKAKLKVIEHGPARAAVEISRKTGKSTFKQIVSLDKDGETVRVYNEVDWRDTASLLKVGFPLASSNPTATYDLGLGVIERGNNSPKLYEVPAQMWADITQPDKSFGVAVFSDSRSGWDKPNDNTLRLTAVHTPLYSYRWECSQHLMDLGLNRFSFGIYSHEGDYTNGVQNAANCFNQPMATFVTRAHKGKLGKRFSFAGISDQSVIIRAIKKAHDGSDQVIVRFNEGAGQGKKSLRFSIGQGIESAREVYASEEDLGPASVEGGDLVFDIGAFEPKSFALKLQKTKTKEKPAAQTPLALEHNVRAITSQGQGAKSELPGALSLPREIIPKVIKSGGINFEISQSESANALLCRGQKINLPQNTKKLHLLAASLDADRRVCIKVGQEDVCIRPQDWQEAPAAWDLIGLGELAYVKKSVLGWNSTHAHSPKGDEIAKQLYFFKHSIDIAQGVDHIILPKVEEILILAMTASEDESNFEHGDFLFDTVNRRSFDYKISAEEYIKARPSVAEAFLRKKIDGEKALTVDSKMVTGTIQLADVFAVVRSRLSRDN